MTDLDVSNLLLLKLVYGFFQLSGGASGVHGGPLELALGLGHRQPRYTDNVGTGDTLWGSPLSAAGNWCYVDTI